MSFVQATPEFVAAAATDLARIGSTISSANTAALGPTSGVLAPGADEVSASIAALFDAHSQVYQALSAQAAAFHSQFVQLMNGGALQYAVTEAANTTPLQSAAGPASVAAQLPAVSGAVGGSAPTAPAAPLAAAVAPAAAAATPGPAGTPVAAAPAGSATLASATAPAGPARVATPAYAPAGSPSPVQPAASSAPAPAGTPAAAAQPEAAPQTSAGPALPVSARPAPHAPAQAQPATAPVRRMPIVPPESG
ncbi:PE family protein [Mycobacterium avium]|uniref:PE family protein n=2 Tax=Mycobacterium avium TaxID=1764 RepID=A0A3B6XF51_MYCAV|nr:PE family protein [Mycobacterium avium]TXA42601.1 PE family protein [Mycobacterium tuberculosis variant bovis]ATO65369.2 PE family protein [Mycobacterium avium subsp. hominissuis]ATO69940.2 PE family protein [Mycobacterium avium subsp. hominissuis]ATO74435.2 PE family protein [Mycobacterium avium subsp. hominissuis]AXO25463.1 PE family protein [Mycobacterium avium subsp. hominissuis]